MAIIYSTAHDLEAALKRAAAAHDKHETELGHKDANWPEWYALYMAEERAGLEHA